MAAYLIFDVDIHDMAKYGEFMAAVKPAIEAAGGRYLVRGGAHKVLEGDWTPTRLVLFEFPSVEAAEGFYNGPVYQGLRTVRLQSSTAKALVVVQPSRWSRSRIAALSSFRPANTLVPPQASIAATCCIPKTWNSGLTDNSRSSGPKRRCCANPSAEAATALPDCKHPLGRPVVPLVYIM